MVWSLVDEWAVGRRRRGRSLFACAGRDDLESDRRARWDEPRCVVDGRRKPTLRKKRVAVDGEKKWEKKDAKRS